METSDDVSVISMWNVTRLTSDSLAMSMVVITIITRSDGGKLVIKKVLHVGRKDATESGVGGGHASKGSTVCAMIKMMEEV